MVARCCELNRGDFSMATIGESGQCSVGDQKEHNEEPVAGVRKKMGRPRKLELNDRTLALIEAWASVGCTVSDIASGLGVDKKTLIKFKSDYPHAREAWEGGRARGFV